MKTTWWGALVFLVLTAFGCARSDWIERTLVTADVTGVWLGSYTGSGAGVASVIELTLQQSGPKVMGQLRVAPGRTDPIEGTVSGDVFSFRDERGRVTRELQVNGDEMTGRATGLFAMGSGSLPLTLRRQP